MKIKTLLILIFFPILCLGQSDKHILFGINLDLDWYSLTGQQTLAYWTQDQDKSSEFVITDCEYILDKIESKFLDLGLDEKLLFFPKGYKGNMKDLKPDMFLARKYYLNISDYNNNSTKDINRCIALLSEAYGNPELNMIKDKYSVYKWKGIYFKLILTCREDELATTLVYSKE